MARCLIAAAALAAGSLAADEPLLVRSRQSGRWSSADTWQGGRTPTAGDRVQILPGHVVTYDLASDDVYRAINIAGTLAFAGDRNTRLNAGLIKIEASEVFSEEGFDCEAHLAEPDPAAPRATLQVGTPNEPIPAQFTAVIRLHAVEGLDPKSCPAIVCCGGRMDFHGAPLSRTWVKLGTTAKAGDASIELAEEVAGWRPGDKLIITATRSDRSTGGTRRPSRRTEDVFTEERTIAAVDGRQLTLDRSLQYEHSGSGELRGEVANLSRNVIVESADPAGTRGHTMYHRYSAGAISYAEFRHLGKEGQLGRYSLHYHLVGNTMRGSYVVGASIWDSHNRWLTIHGTNYLVVRDCVGYQSVGHGFFLEDGTEVCNVLDRNLAVQAYSGRPLPKQVLPFDANDGAGFWWANSLNTFTRNVACENDRYGFRFEATPSSAFNIASPRVMRPDGTFEATDIRTLPFVRFEGNEAHCDGRYGINLGEGVNRVGPDTAHPFVMKDTKIWQVHYALRPQSPSLLIENLHIEECDYGVYHPHYEHHSYKNVRILTTDAEPFNRGHDDDSAQYGPLAVDGLEFSARYFGGDMPFIQISDNNPTGRGVSHFRHVRVLNRPQRGGKPLINLGGGPRPTPKTEHGVPCYVHDYFGPGRHAKVVSTKAKDLLSDGNSYRSEPPLTGDESVVAEVTGIEFPTLLQPVDDLPPITVITHVGPPGRDGIPVRGTVSDNGQVRRVIVNGQEAKIDPAAGTWEIVLPRPGGELRLQAHSEDAGGNMEKLPHQLTWR
jgi:hypothetical protein